MTSSAQIFANQKNAHKSTGPVTGEGKTKVSNNAIKHGLFSKQLILSDEDPAEFQNLIEQLQVELAPASVLEQTLTERIAVSIWRQKRLIRAETATIELERKPKNIASAVNSELGLSFSGHSIFETDLSEFDAEQYQWCQSVLQEYENLAFDNLLDIDRLKKSAPLIYQQLITDAEEEHEEPVEFLTAYEQPIQYFFDLTSYCREQIKQAEQRPMVMEIAAMIKNKRAILHDRVREALAKYQVMLDNELYKAMKALREAQEWRLKSLPITPESKNGFVLEN